MCGNEYEVCPMGAGRARFCSECREAAAQERYQERLAEGRIKNKGYQNPHDFSRKLTPGCQAVRAYILEHPGLTVAEIARGMGLKYSAVFGSITFIRDLCEEEGRLTVFVDQVVDYEKPRWSCRVSGRKV